MVDIEGRVQSTDFTFPGRHFKFHESLNASAVLDWFCLAIAEFNAPVDVHDIATKPLPQLMELGHGALSAFCSIIIQMNQLNAFVVGWRVEE